MSKISQLQKEVQELKKQLGYSVIKLSGSTNRISTGEEKIYCAPWITIAEQIDAICEHLEIDVVRVSSHIETKMREDGDKL